MVAPEHSAKSKGYLVLKDREFLGPFSRDELGKKITEGVLAPGDLAQIENTPIWQPVRAILNPPSPSAAAAASVADSQPPTLDWWLLGRWTLLLLQRELHAPSARATVAFLIIGAGALMLCRWTFVFWLPWFALALISSVLLMAIGRKAVGMALTVCVVALPFLLLRWGGAPGKSKPFLASSVTVPGPIAAGPTPAPELAPVLNPARPEANQDTPLEQPVVVVPATAPVALTSEPTLEPVSAPLVPVTVPSAPAQPASAPDPLTTSSPNLAQRVSGLVKSFLGDVSANPPPAPVAAAPPPPVVAPVAAATPVPAPPAALATPTPEPKENVAGNFVREHSRTLVVIKDEHGAGSGFIATMGGRAYLFTNIHVSAMMKQPQFTLLDGTRLTAVSVEAAVGHDIMRLGLKDVPRQTLECAAELDTVTRIGDEIFVLGNSGGAGVVTSLPGKLVGLGPDRIEVSAAFIPGNSGSPIIHAATGRVIGVATYLTKRYEEFSGPAATTTGSGGEVVVRRFGFRLDSVRTWEPVNWLGFQAEAEQLRQVSLLTEDIFDLLGALRKGSAPQVRSEALRRAVADWRQKINKPRAAEADLLSATQGFLNALRFIVRSDIASLESRLRYSYFREELREERAVRDRLFKHFDAQSKKLSMPSVRGF